MDGRLFQSWLANFLFKNSRNFEFCYSDDFLEFAIQNLPLVSFRLIVLVRSSLKRSRTNDNATLSPLLSPADHFLTVITCLLAQAVILVVIDAAFDA